MKTAHALSMPLFARLGLTLLCASTFLIFSGCEERSAKAIFPEKFEKKEHTEEQEKETLEKKAETDAEFFPPASSN